MIALFYIALFAIIAAEVAQELRGESWANVDTLAGAFFAVFFPLVLVCAISGDL